MLADQAGSFSGRDVATLVICLDQHALTQASIKRAAPGRRFVVALGCEDLAGHAICVASLASLNHLAVLSAGGNLGSEADQGRAGAVLGVHLGASDGLLARHVATSGHKVTVGDGAAIAYAEATAQDFRDASGVVALARAHIGARLDGLACGHWPLGQLALSACSAGAASAFAEVARNFLGLGAKH